MDPYRKISPSRSPGRESTQRLCTCSINCFKKLVPIKTQCDCGAKESSNWLELFGVLKLPNILLSLSQGTKKQSVKQSEK